MISKLAVLGTFALASAEQCADPGNTDNGWRIDMEQFPDGSVKEVFYKCQPGYEVDGYGRDTIELRCNEAGEWNYTPPSQNPNFCAQVASFTEADFNGAQEETTMAQSCEELDNIPNAQRFVTSFDHGGQVVFSCDPGFCDRNERSRSIMLSCRHGSWSGSIPRCEPCPACAPISDEELTFKRASAVINDDYTMTVTCNTNHVIKPGSDQYNMDIDCIADDYNDDGIISSQWAMEVPHCTRPSEVNCGESEITINIDADVMKAFDWAGDENNLILYGNDINQIPPADCQATVVTGDNGSTYTWRIPTPFSDTCRTALEMDNENYVFSNKIVWNYSRNNAISKSAVLLKFECVYEGLFVSHLDNPIKLAISTHTYSVTDIEARSLSGVPAGTTFTGSMAIYSNSNFTNLIDNVPILHRGKRYYVEMSLHEQELGTPFLQNCYGSSNFRSEQELASMYLPPSSPDQIKPMISGGCPKANSLIRLEYSPNHHSRRFSFLFPKLNVGIAELRYLYIHCEIALVAYGTRPSCSTLNTDAINARNGGSVIGRNGIAFNNLMNLNERQNVGEGNDIIDGVEAYKEDRANGVDTSISSEDNIVTDDMFEIFGNMDSTDVEEVDFSMTRRKRSVSNDHSFSFGPVVFPPKEDEEVVDMNLILPDEIIAKPKPQTSDEVLVEEIEEVEELLESTLEDDLDRMVNEEQQKRMIVVICVIVGGIFVFVVATLVGINVNLSSCMGGDDSDSTKEVVKRPKKSTRNAHVIPDSSCATSQQSVSMS